MKINFLSVKDGVAPDSYWDQTFIKDLFEDLPQGDREVFVIPGAYQADVVSEINKELAKYDKVMVFITSDEEGNFDCSKLEHPDIIHYCQYGNCENVFPLGYTPHVRKYAKNTDKIYDIFFLGQINHSRREQMQKEFMKIKEQDGVYFVPTEGFAQGLSPEGYVEQISKAKCVVCPPGNVTQDSFRVYEALEVGAVPIVDEFSPSGESGYWEKLFPDSPFPILRSYEELEHFKKEYSTVEMRNKVFAWWINKKQEIKDKLAFQCGCPIYATTPIVVTSPIPSHPSTSIIDESVDSIRFHFKDNQILIGVDGIRDEQKEKKEVYVKYISNLLWNSNHKYGNTKVFLFDEHAHQSGMMKKILPEVRSPLILFVEHDTPLVTDEPIDFEYLQKVLLKGDSFLIRFHYEAHIPKEHEYMMIGEPENYLLKTYQWSQRPHLARTDFYGSVMLFFSENSNCFIEDYLHGKAIDAWKADGMDGWNRWRMHIYIPGDNIKRSLNLDGRRDNPKWDDLQIW